MNYTRTTHDHDGALVVFLIGMRVNRPSRVGAWLPVARAMPRMLRELADDPASGLLGHRLTLEGRGVTVVQYWESVEKLYAYASAPDHEHRPAWRAFNTAARRHPGAVAIWHETFVVSRAESLYGDVLRPQGLAAATRSVPVGPRAETARDRLAGAH